MKNDHLRPTHTYNIHQRFHCCPKCGRIVESRTDYTYSLGKYTKELDCDRCEHRWTEQKAGELTFGPLFN